MSGAVCLRHFQSDIDHHPLAAIILWLTPSPLRPDVLARSLADWVGLTNRNTDDGNGDDVGYPGRTVQCWVDPARDDPRDRRCCRGGGADPPEDVSPLPPRRAVTRPSRWPIPPPPRDAMSDLVPM